MTKENDWMLKLQKNDRTLVELCSNYTDADTYAGTVREALTFYLGAKEGEMFEEFEQVPTCDCGREKVNGGHSGYVCPVCFDPEGGDFGEGR